MNKVHQVQFERSKKIRFYAIMAYLLSPAPLLLSQQLGRGITYGLVVSLIVTGFSLSFQYACPGCGRAIQITKSPKKLTRCPYCKTDLTQNTK